MSELHFKQNDTVAVLLAVLLAVASMTTGSPFLFSLCWFGAAAVLFYVILKHRDLAVWVRTLLTVTVFVMAGAISAYNYSDYLEKQLVVRDGILYPDNLPRPELPCRVSADALAVILGNSVGWAVGSQITLLQVTNHPLIQIERLPNGSVRLSNMVIYDDRNQIVAKTEDRVFMIRDIGKGEMASKSNLIVFDYRGREVFNIDLLNRNTLKISGRFTDGVVKPIIIDRDGPIHIGRNVFDRDCLGGGAGVVFQIGPRNPPTAPRQVPALPAQPGTK